MGIFINITCHFLFPGHRAFVIQSKSSYNVVKLRRKLLFDILVVFTEFYQTPCSCYRELAYSAEMSTRLWHPQFG